MKINMHEAKSQLSRLGKMAWAGEDVVIVSAGQPYLRLAPYRKRKTGPKLGALKGQIWIAPDFDETPPEVVQAFWNSKMFPGGGESSAA